VWSRVPTCDVGHECLGCCYYYYNCCCCVSRSGTEVATRGTSRQEWGQMGSRRTSTRRSSLFSRTVSAPVLCPRFRSSPRAGAAVLAWSRSSSRMIVVRMSCPVPSFPVVSCRVLLTCCRDHCWC
jgi:hypothetical protein